MSSESTPPVTPSTELFRTTRPRVVGILGVVLGVLLAAASAVLLAFALPGGDGALVVPGVAIGMLAIAAVVIGLLAFQVARRPLPAIPLLRPLQVITILTVLIGFVGAGIGITRGLIEGSVAGIGAGGVAVPLAILVGLLGATVYGTADQRPAASA